MWNRYMVTCPDFSCDWSGRLSPNRDVCVESEFELTDAIVTFQCPHCLNEWRAQVHVDPLPMDASEESLACALWPPLEIGVGD